MPLYTQKFTVPAGTSAEKPYTFDIKIKDKLVNKMEIGFPDGCNFLVGVQIRYGLKRFWPEKKGTWIYGNDETVSWDEHFIAPRIPYKLTIAAISPDTVYDHDIIVRIFTLPLLVAAPYIILEKILYWLERIYLLKRS